MGKSRSKSYRSGWDDEDDYEYYDSRSAERHRKEKRMKNLIRSKNVDQLMEMDNDDGLYEWGDNWEERR